MSDSFIIRPGDLVVCIDGSAHQPQTYLSLQVKDRLTEGACYRVADVVWLYGEKGLHLENMDHRPTDGWRAGRFRKVDLAGSAINGSSEARVTPDHHHAVEGDPERGDGGR